MKTEDKIKQDVITYAKNIAYGRTEDDDVMCRFLGLYKNKFKEPSIDDFPFSKDYNWAQNIAKEIKDGGYIISDLNMGKIFLHIFDKSLERFYIEPTDEYEINLEAHLEDAFVDGFYLPAISESLCIKLEMEAPCIVMVGEMTYYYMQEKGYLYFPLNEWLYYYFCAASYLAKIFLLEQI